MGIEEAAVACLEISDNNIQIFPAPELPANYYRGNVGECLGHACVLGKLDQKTYNRLKDMSAGDYEVDKPSIPNSASFAIIREAGCVSTYTHPLRNWIGVWGGKAGYPRQEKMFISNMAISLPFDTVCGPLYDALDIVMANNEAADNELAFHLWCNLLNEGYRITATGNSDCCFDRIPEPVPGNGRTLVYHSGEVPTLKDIQDGIRKMRCLATNGPLLSAEVEGETIAGMQIPTSSGRKQLHIASCFPKSGENIIIELIKNGLVISEFQQEDSDCIANFAIDLDVAENCWYAVRSYDENKRYHAVLNPFFVSDDAYVSPKMVISDIEIKVFSEEGTPLAGTLEIVNYGLEKESDVIESIPFSEGKISLKISPSYGVKIKVAGYEDQEQCLFFADSVFDFIRKLTKKDLIDSGIFKKFRESLARISLEMNMKKV